VGACFLGCVGGGVSTAEEQKEEQIGNFSLHRRVCWRWSFDIIGDCAMLITFCKVVSLRLLNFIIVHTSPVLQISKANPSVSITSLELIYS